MSSLRSRRNDLPSRRSSGMHPGWACFMAALGSGFFMAFAMAGLVVSATRGDPDYLGFTILISISVTLFIIGGRKAERLHERP